MLWKSVLFGNADFDIDNCAPPKAFAEGFNVSLSRTAKFTSVSNLSDCLLSDLFWLTLR
jgi:hypothetical protein